MYIKEKKIFCGDKHLEVDIIPHVKRKYRNGTRNKKKNVSAPKQKNLNDKMAKRYFIQLANTNFSKNDYHVSLTYDNDHLPGSIEESEKEVRKYLRRLKYHMDKDGTDLKYLLVTENNTKKDGTLRVHHHIIMNGGLSRDRIEELWSKGDKAIGYANVDRLQPNEKGLEALCMYLSKNPKGRKRWSSSQNLKKPQRRDNDCKYSRRQVEKLARSPNDIDKWERLYPSYRITEIKPEYYEMTGWSIYLKMIKRE